MPVSDLRLANFKQPPCKPSRGVIGADGNGGERMTTSNPRLRISTTKIARRKVDHLQNETTTTEGTTTTCAVRRVTDQSGIHNRSQTSTRRLNYKERNTVVPSQQPGLRLLRSTQTCRQVATGWMSSNSVCRLQKQAKAATLIQISPWRHSGRILRSLLTLIPRSAQPTFTSRLQRRRPF